MDLVQAVQAMNQAQAARLKADPSDRERQALQVLENFELRLSTDADGIAQLMESSIGVPRRRVLAEMIPTATRLMQKLRSFTFESNQSGALGSYPSAGHCAVFLGWTDPLVSFVRRVPVLFAAGNSVCLKPSRVSAPVYQKLAELWSLSLDSAGVHPGFFRILHGVGEGEDQIGELILRHPAMKSIYWIGRTQSALKARGTALQFEKRFFYSGSGRNPALIFPNPKLDEFETQVRQMADLVLDPHGMGPFRPSRFFIQESVYKTTMEIMTDQFSKVQADGLLGPLPMVECQRFDQQLKLALSETGKIVTGGLRDGSLIQPTLIRDLTNCSTLQGEELAGPVMTAASFKYLHEALKYANTSPLGLSAYLLHPELEKRQTIAAKIEASRVLGRPDLPRSEYLFESAAPVKQSQSADDGLAAITSSSQWRSRLFE